MTKNELFELLKEYLTIQTEIRENWDGDPESGSYMSLKTTILFDDEEICESEDYFRT